MLEKPTSYSLLQKELNLEQKVGQLFMLAVFINDTEEAVQKTEKLIREHCIGALCFFHSRASAATNFEGKKEVIHNENSYNRLQQLIARYQSAATYPLLMAMDAEWGLAMRIENTPQYPYAITLGAVQNKDELLVEVGQRIGLDCREAGINWNLAPVVDINSNPENPVIGYRSFGDNTKIVTSKAKAYLRGMESTGTLNSIKHFPGHGDTATDSHLGLPVIDKSKEELKKNELYPFQELINEGVDSVMVGHLSLPQLDSLEPSTTSTPIITDLLRHEMNFKGVIISDALNMHAVSKRYPNKGTLEAAAFRAGMDMLCFSEHVHEGIDQIVKTASKNQIEESFGRIKQLKEKAFATKDFPKISEVKSPSILNRKVAQNALTALYGNPTTVEEIKNSTFLNLSLNNTATNSFSQKLETIFNHKVWEISTQTLVVEKELQQHQHVVLALFPPAVKPKNQFGFDPEILDFIRKIVAEKNVLIYLFGNPYVLDMLNLNPTSNAVAVFQDFEVFQEEAVRHFTGEAPGFGKLPITLKTFHP